MHAYMRTASENAENHCIGTAQCAVALTPVFELEMRDDLRQIKSHVPLN